MNLSSTFGYSPRPPVSVYGTGHSYLIDRDFSRKSVYCVYPLIRGLAVLSRSTSYRLFTRYNISTRFNVLFRQYARMSLLRLPFSL